jgi:hypothetical protein
VSQQLVMNMSRDKEGMMALDKAGLMMIARGGQMGLAAVTRVVDLIVNSGVAGSGEPLFAPLRAALIRRAC